MGRWWRRRPRRSTAAIFFLSSSLQASIALLSWFIRLAPWLLHWRGDRRSSRLRDGDSQQPRSYDRSSRTVTGLEMEAGRNLGLHGRLEEVDHLRGLHHLAARGMNRLVSGEVAGGSGSEK